MALKKNNIALLLGLVALLLAAFATWKTTGNNENGENAYVNLQELFDGFEMKKEMELKLKKDLAQKQSGLDSLLFQLQSLGNKIKSEEGKNDQEVAQFQQIQGYYMQQKNTFEEYQYSKTQEVDAQIVDQMTQYVKDFGSTSRYTFIYGANSNGNIMYAKEHKDITKEVLKFINDKYQGRN